MAQVGLIAEAYIELAAVPAPDKANQMPFPSHLRRSTKALNKVQAWSDDAIEYWPCCAKCHSPQKLECFFSGFVGACG